MLFVAESNAVNSKSLSSGVMVKLFKRNNSFVLIIVKTVKNDLTPIQITSVVHALIKLQIYYGAIYSYYLITKYYILLVLLNF